MSRLTPMKAIRAKCLDCCCGSFFEVRECTAITCPLYPYKSGHKPKEGTQEYNFITKRTLSLNTPLSPIVNGKERMIKENALIFTDQSQYQSQPQTILERISKL